MMHPKETALRVNQALRARRIPHGAFKAAYERGKELLTLPDCGMPGSGILVHGESGVGKSALTHALVEYGAKHYHPDAVLRTQLSTGATIKGVISDLLESFGDPLPKRGDVRDLITRLKDSIVGRKCRLIEIDETQHLMPGGNPSRYLIDNILNSFKILDDTGVSFVLAGTDDILSLWSADKQIRSRFQVPFELSALKYPDGRASWRGIVAKFDETIEQHGMEIDCADHADHLHAACNGCMRPLVLILTTAVTTACARGSLVITANDLHSAAMTQVDPRDGKPDAFDLDLEEVQRHSRACHVSRQLAPTERGLNEILRK